MNFSLILFLLLLGILSAIFIFHSVENYRLKNYLRKKYGAELINKISRFFLYQTSALLITMALLLAIIAALYWQLDSVRQQVQLLKSLDYAEEEKTIPPANTQIPAQNQTQEVAKTTPPPTQNSDQKSAEKSNIRDLFEAEPSNSDSKNAIDNLKSRYEQTLITYFFLQKCGKVGDSDYNLIFIALQNEMRQLQAPSRLQYDILTAAKGSYDEVYAKNDCTEANITPIYQQYNSYIQSLSGKQQ